MAKKIKTSEKSPLSSEQLELLARAQDLDKVLEDGIGSRIRASREARGSVAQDFVCNFTDKCF